jgi:hypothetical protein
MRRAVWTMMVVGVLVAATGFANPTVARAAPGYFNFSVGTPGYNLGYGYAAPAPYVYPVAPQPYVAQPYVAQSYAYGGVGPSMSFGFGYPGYGYGAPYRAYYGGYGGPGCYGHHGHHHHW